MRLYVVNPKDGSKSYLQHTAKNRAELRKAIGGKHFKLADNTYSVEVVRAETSSNDISVSAAIGSAVGGLILGPVGYASGALAGLILARRNLRGEKKEVEGFNRSSV